MVVGARHGTGRGSPLAGRKRRPGWGARVNNHRLGSARLVLRRSGLRAPRAMMLPLLHPAVAAAAVVLRLASSSRSFLRSICTHFPLACIANMLSSFATTLHDHPCTKMAFGSQPTLTVALLFLTTVTGGEEESTFMIGAD